MLILEAESIEAGPSFTVFFETMFFKQHTATHSYSEAGVSAQKKKQHPKNPKTHSDLIGQQTDPACWKS